MFCGGLSRATFGPCLVITTAPGVVQADSYNGLKDHRLLYLLYSTVVVGYYTSRIVGYYLSKATSLVEIRDGAFSATNLEGKLVIPANVTMIGKAAFQDTKLSSLDLSKATLLVSIGSRGAFSSECNVCGAENYSANILRCEPCQVGYFCEEGANVGTRCALSASPPKAAAQRATVRVRLLQWRV